VSSRRDVVGGHTVAEDRQHPRSANIFDRPGSLRHLIEERGPLDVSRIRLPGKQVTRWNGQTLPRLITREYVAVLLPEHLAAQRGTDCVLYFAAVGPDVAQVNIAR